MPSLWTTDPDTLLAARRSLRGADGDGTYLDHFVQVLCRLDAARHGFRADDLATSRRPGSAKRARAGPAASSHG